MLPTFAIRACFHATQVVVNGYTIFYAITIRWSASIEGPSYGCIAAYFPPPTICSGCGIAVLNAAEMLARKTLLALPETDRLILVAGLNDTFCFYITPAIACLAKQAGIEVMGLVYLPTFWEAFEGRREMAEESLSALASVVDKLHVIDMQKDSQETPLFLCFEYDPGISLINELIEVL